MLVATILLLQPDIYVLPTVTAVSTRFLAMPNELATQCCSPLTGLHFNKVLEKS